MNQQRKIDANYAEGQSLILNAKGNSQTANLVKSKKKVHISSKNKNLKIDCIETKKILAIKTIKSKDKNRNNIGEIEQKRGQTGKRMGN